MKKNYYEILEISPNASPEIIEKAYKTLTRKYHPDIQPKDQLKDAENQFKEIVRAYEVLSDPEQRTEYDEYQKLKSDADSLKDTNNAKQDSKKIKDKFGIVYYTKMGVQSIGTVLYNHTKKSKNERSKDIKALVITLVIMIILVLLFWNIPFLKKFLFP